MKTYFLLLISIAATLVVESQDADRLYKSLALQEAILEYESKLASGQYDGEDLFQLANAYRLNNQIIKAERWFGEAVEKSENPDAKFYYAQVLLMNGKPAEAKEWFQSYRTIADPTQKDKIDQFIILSEQISLNQVEEHSFEIKKAPFNSDKLDFSPTYYGKDIVFTSNREESTGSATDLDNWTHQKYTDLFVVKLSEGGKVETFSEKFNSNLHESTGTFTADQKTFYFTRSNLVKRKQRNDKDENVRLQIMASYNAKGEWTAPELLSINNENYSFAHPTLSQDGNTMIFASDQPGGEGGMDLYVVHREEDEWGIPKNLGPAINTPGNEVFPNLDKNNKLYFSSNFHAGFGGLDIFEAYYRDESWISPTNLGIPINSVRDDFGIISKYNFKEGYFSSSRSGDDQIYSFDNLGSIMINGKAISCETKKPIPYVEVIAKNEDRVVKKMKTDELGIFSFELDQQYAKLTFSASKENFRMSTECISNETVDIKSGVNVVLMHLESSKINSGLQLCGKIINKDCDFLLPRVDVKLVNICNGEELTVQSDENGQFEAPLMDDCKYKLVAEKNNFAPVVKYFQTKNIATECLDFEVFMTSALSDEVPSFKQNEDDQLPNNQDRQDELITLKEGTVLTLYNIYFDYGKATIRSDAAGELEWLLQIMQENPSMKVEISAHTDSRSSSSFNKKLSQRRANTARDWLVERGVSENNITAKGYGETKILNKCENNVPCSSLEHQRNRRIEFKVTNFSTETTVSREWDVYDNKDDNKIMNVNNITLK